jgi:hypothetical protein
MLRHRFQHIAWLRDFREIDLRPELILSRVVLLRRRTFAGVFWNAEMLLYFLCFVRLERTGVGLLFCDAEIGQHIQDGLAFHFQLTSQIIDSNLHPPFISSVSCFAAMCSFQSHGSQVSTKLLGALIAPSRSI